jgi:hypothetical protein
MKLLKAKDCRFEKYERKGRKLKMENFINKYCIVRGENSGVFFGIVKNINGQIVKMEQVRKLYYWDGAFCVEGLAEGGVSRPQNCKFTVVVDNLIITDEVQIIPCTQKAIDSLSGVKVWQI